MGLAACSIQVCGARPARDGNIGAKVGAEATGSGGADLVNADGVKVEAVGGAADGRVGARAVAVLALLSAVGWGGGGREGH